MHFTLLAGCIIKFNSTTKVYVAKKANFCYSRHAWKHLWLQINGCTFIYHLQTTSYIPLTLSSINVPREVNILYLNNVVKLVEYGQVLRSFRNVNYFFFWTGFNGTKTFRRGAPKDVHIYGGGIVAIDIHYYNYNRVQGVYYSQPPWHGSPLPPDLLWSS